MGKKLIIAAFVALFVISCSTDNDSTQIVQTIPEIADLVTVIPDSKFDNISKGKYVGIFGHHLDQELHGKIYINAGLDTRYKALIQLVNGQELNFVGKKSFKINPDLISFEGEMGSFTIDFTHFRKPKVTNVFIKDTDTEAYIVLAKSTRGGDPFVLLGSYVDSSDPAFFGNWDLMTSQVTTQATPFTTTLSGLSVSGTVVTQEIVALTISHTASMTPFTSNSPDDFDTNTAIACAPVGVMIPTTEPVIMDIFVTTPFPLGDVGDAISAGGQTSMINGVEATWSLNYTTEINNPLGPNLPETYVADDCNTILSGTWSWNGRSGTTTVF